MRTAKKKKHSKQAKEVKKKYRLNCSIKRIELGVLECEIADSNSGKEICF